MNVLYLSHTSTISGAEHSLLELLAALPADIRPTLACPPGEFTAAAGALGVPLALLPPLELGFRLGLSRTTRGLAQGARAALAVLRLGRGPQWSLVHANSVRAGLVAIPLARLGGPPLVVHVRDVLPPSRAGVIARRAVTGSAALILANSRYTARSFAGRDDVEGISTVYNAVDLARFSPEAISREQARARLGLHPLAPVLGLVAQITPWKGQDTGIRMLGHLHADQPGAQLLLVGAPKFATGAEKYDNEAYHRQLRQLAVDLGIRDSVSFLGHRSDVPTILRALDLLLVPSWEEPFGRTVIEAMAMEVPVLATCVGGPGEVIADGEDGLLLPPRDPARWAAAAADLLAKPELRAQMGARGRRKVVAGFSREAHVTAVRSAYEFALERSAR